MNGILKRTSILFLFLTFGFILSAGFLSGCTQNDENTVSVGRVNLAKTEFEFDGHGRLVSAVYEALDETKSSVYSDIGVPVFVNGSIVAGGDIGMEDADGFLVDFYPVFEELYYNKSRSVSRSSTKAQFRLDDPDVIEYIEFSHETGEIIVNGVVLENMSFTTETPDENSFPHHIYVTPDVCAAILKLNVTIFDPDALNAEGFRPYLANEDQIIFWRYPPGAVQLSKEEALDKMKSALIEAYENTYGRFTPLTEEPVSSPYPGDEIMLRWQIPNLTITGENDRFYRVEFMGEMLIDHWTGDIYRYYNGLAQFFTEFDPKSPGALMFAG